MHAILRSAREHQPERGVEWDGLAESPATSSIPAGAGTTPLPGVLRLLVLGPSASLIRSEPPTTQGSGLSLCPAPMPQGVSYVQISAAYIRNVIPSGGSCLEGAARRRSWPIGAGQY